MVALDIHRPDDLAGWRSAAEGRAAVRLSGDIEELELLLDDGEGESPWAFVGRSQRLPQVLASCVWPGPLGKARRRARPRWRQVLLSSRGKSGGQRLIDEDLWQIAGVENILAFGAFRRLGRRAGSADESTYSNVATLFDEDATLAGGMEWLIHLHHRGLTGDAEAARTVDAAIALLNDGLLPDGHVVTEVTPEGFRLRDGDSEFLITEMSEGHRAAVALVINILAMLSAPLMPGQEESEAFDVFTLGPSPTVWVPGVVLIDEVDAHLHVSWQQRIGGWLKTHFPNVQFIVTTHSPYICQAADPGGLIRLAGPGEDEPPRVVDEELYQRIVYGSGDDTAMSALFGLESPDSPQAEAERRRLVALERRVYAEQASAEEIAEYEALGEKLNNSLSASVTETAARLRTAG